MRLILWHSFLALVLSAPSCSDEKGKTPSDQIPAFAEPATVVGNPQWFIATNPNLGLVEVIPKKGGGKRAALITKPFPHGKGDAVLILEMRYEQWYTASHTVVWAVVARPQ